MSKIDKRKKFFKKIADHEEAKSDENFVNDVNNADDISEFVDQLVDSLIDQAFQDV